MKFNEVWQVVEPKRKARDKANSELNTARNKLTELRNMILVRYKYGWNIYAVLQYYRFLSLGTGTKTTNFNRRI